MDFSWVIPPVVGSVIGYSTNWLAIKMLFKPHKAKYIGKVKVPFTPGVIPRERDRIASSLGEAVGNNLLTEEVILKELTDEKVLDQIRHFIEQDLLKDAFCMEDILRNVYEDDESLGKLYEQFAARIHQAIIQETEDNQGIKMIVQEAFAEHFKYEHSLMDGLSSASEESVRKFITDNSGFIETQVMELLTHEEIKLKIIGTIERILMEKVGAMAAMFVQPEGLYNMLVEYVGNFLAEEENRNKVANKISDVLLIMMNQPLSELMDSHQYDEIIGHAATFVDRKVMEVVKSPKMNQLIINILKSFTKESFTLDIQMKQLISEHIIKLYKGFASSHLPVFIEQFNVAGIVESEINRFSVSEVENLIFAIVDKELRAITWFGAVLGFAMGLVTILF